MSKHPMIFFWIVIISFTRATAQQDSLTTEATLNQCVSYAMQHQPAINQAYIDERIVNAEIKSRIADWYPQIGLDYSLQHYFKTPVSIINGNPVATAQKNYSTAFFSVTQNIFNADALLASRTSGEVRTQAKQYVENNKIYVTLNVSKAFYDVLLSQQQLVLVDQDIARLARSVKDSYNQYVAGVTDKTDYKRAQISLNNSYADKKRYEEQLTAKTSVLKLLMGYPQDSTIRLKYDSTRLRDDAFIDTLQEVNYSNRIEYKILQTQQSLLQSNLSYYKWAFIPSISAFGNYNIVYANNDFSKLYKNDYPSSFVGLSLSFPIFQGGKRSWQIKSADLQLDRLQYNFVSLRDSIQNEYTQALATYKAAVNDFFLQKENLDLALDVYNTTYLQYKMGVKAYLEVIVAESALRSSQVNHLDALFEVLISKLDVEKALGTLTQ